MSPRVVVAGEALIDLMIGDDPRRPAAFPGGSPANTAIALARLGTPVGFLGRFGNDRFGDLLLANLAANGVDLAHAVEAAEPASLAVVACGQDGGPAYGFHVTGTADWGWRDGELPDLPDDVQAVHTGSLAVALAPGADHLTRWYADQRSRRVTSLDPNVRPGLVGPRPDYLARLDALVAASDVVKVSADDLTWTHPDADPAEVALRWQRDLGPALVVVTLGGDGALAVHSGQVVRRTARPRTVVDTVGAGDAFSGGLLHWLGERGLLRRDRLLALDRAELDHALDYAITVAGLACARPGADPPHHTEVEVHP